MSPHNRNYQLSHTQNTEGHQRHVIDPLLAGTDIKDPKAPLSMENFLNLLLNQCDLKIQNNNIIERDLTSDKIKLIVDHFNNRLCKVNDDIDKLTDTIDVKVSAVDLKIDTISTYLEQLLYNLKHGLHDTFSLIQEDVKSVWDRLNANNSNHDGTRPNIEEQMLVNITTFSCNICSSTFQSSEHLANHLTRYHAVVDCCLCSFCGHFFESETMLRNHMTASHTPPVSSQPNLHPSQADQSPDPGTCFHHPCEDCNIGFEQFVELCEHMRDSHQSLSFFPCVHCERVFRSANDMETHIDKHHENIMEESVDSVSVIPQLDGLDDHELSTTSNSNDVLIRTANYVLNEEKQTEKIVKDASKVDYEVDVNNQDQNATIRCSP